MPSRVARGEFRIWDDGRPVAYAGCNDAAPDFARIAPVYTLPECRGRGYATALVAALARELLGRGKRKLFLTTDVANPTSNAIYARIGFRAENDDCALRFRRASRLRRMAAPRFMCTQPPRAGARGRHGRPRRLRAAHHATRVLRLAVGDALTLFDGTGGEYAATLVRADKRGASRAGRALRPGRARVAARADAGARHRRERRDGLGDPQGDRARRRPRSSRSSPRGARRCPTASAAESASPTGGRSRRRRPSSAGRNRVPEVAAAALARRMARGVARDRHRASCRKRSGRSPRSRRRRRRSP